VSPSRWERLEVLLEQAGSLSGTEREAFISRETTGDPALAAELARLLEASDAAPDYLSGLRQELLGSNLSGVLHDATAATAPDPWIGRSVSHYRIIERMGGGGMGIIYRARDDRLDRTVALKFISPAIRADARARDRFREEARAASALDHPNICTIHDIGETGDGSQFIVMAAYEGDTLRSRLDRGPLPPTDALDVARQVAGALAAAHQRGIVHRDVKPDNVFLTRDGVVKLLDFGLARMADQRMSGSGSLVGTVAYMSPEQAAGGRTDARTDVWSLGVMLYEALTGERPFRGDTPGEVLDRIRTAEPDLSSLGPEVPPGVTAVLRRALTRDPEERFADGRELLDALAAAGASGTRRPALRAGIAMMLVAAVAVVVIVNRDGPIGPARLGGDILTRVLWVDDNPENNTEVIRRLERAGVTVTTAVSTADALARFDPAGHQLVISDIGRFEGVGDTYVERAGLDLLAQLSDRQRRVRVYFCTSARAANTHRAEALAAGAIGVAEDCAEVLRLVGLE
jgi:CheY-like chemotaxis protein